MKEKEREVVGMKKKCRIVRKEQFHFEKRELFMALPVLPCPTAMEKKLRSYYM